MSVSNIILLGAHNIKFSGGSRPRAVHRGESVPRITWPGPHVSRPVDPPAYTTHSHSEQTLHLTTELMNGCGVCMETSLSHQACLIFSQISLQFQSKSHRRRRTTCVGSYQQWLAWNSASLLWGIWFEKDQIKRIPSVDSLVLTPDPHSLGPRLSWEGASKNSSYK